MVQRFYLYLDNFSYSDCFSTNSVLCQALMPNLKGSRTISRRTENFLFLTHKKVDEENRKQGINDTLTSWPVTLVIEIDTEDYNRFPVVLVSTDEESKLVLKLGDISEYNTESHLGCLAYQELPFYSIKGILFENEDQLRDSDKSIFPDFLWEENKIGIIDPEIFTDVLDLDIDEEKIKEQYSDYEKNNSDENSGLDEKYKSAILQLINGTRNWKHNRYICSFDGTLLKYLGISADVVEKILKQQKMPFDSAFVSAETEPLDLVPSNMNEETASDEQKLYNLIVRVLIANQKKCTPDSVHKLLEEMCDEIPEVVCEEKVADYKEAFIGIEKCYLNSIGYGVEKMLYKIVAVDTENSPLKALLFVIKNPAEYEKFVLSLSLYGVDSVTTRRAMILWGFLNGLRGIPAHGFNRENEVLWKFIEQKTSILCAVPSKYEMKPKMDDIHSQPGETYGIDICVEEVITYEEVYEYLSVAKNVSKALLKEIYTLAKTVDRKRFKEDPYSKYDVTDVGKRIAQLMQEKNYILTKQEVDEIVKDTKLLKKKICLDYMGIYKDWILDEKNFKRIWKIDEKNLKEFFAKRR